MTIKERYKKTIDYFQKQYPSPQTELMYTSSYELIVAVILSAQCTDKRVNIITPPFFKKFPDFLSLAQSTPEQVFPYISSCSYPNNKAKHLVGMAERITQNYNGKLPEDIDEMQKIPGIGRKTANVLAAVLFNQPAMPVDTHVFRVAARIGLVRNAKTPLETEKQLVNNISPSMIPDAHHWLILHGRYICQARKPKCMQCGLREVCTFYSKELRIT
ncbi:MAG: endonuclease III [Bacteroidales bacterium]|nr:endonuclease III [Bacteroidales bacterium]